MSQSKYVFPVILQVVVDLSPDEGDEEHNDGDQEDDENRHMIGVVKVSKDKVEVDGVLGLEEPGSVTRKVIGLALSPNPDVVLELNLRRNMN